MREIKISFARKRKNVKFMYMRVGQKWRTGGGSAVSVVLHIELGSKKCKKWENVDISTNIAKERLGVCILKKWGDVA